MPYFDLTDTYSCLLHNQPLIFSMYSLVLTLAGILVVYFLYWLNNQIRFRRLLDKFPGKKSNFLLGDVLEFTTNRDNIFLKYRQFAKEFPTGYRFYAGQYGILNLITPEDVEVILSSPRHIEKTLVYALLERWLGTGLLTSGGEKWANRRKILTPAFHFKVLQRFLTVFSNRSEKFITELKDECNKENTNIVPLVSTLAVNVICETAMGISVDSYDKLKMIEYKKAVHELGILIILRIFRPWYYNNLIYLLTPYARQEKKYVKTLHQFTEEVINEREKTFNASDVENMDADNANDEGIYAKKRFAMLDLLLLAKKRGEIDDAGIREEVDTFMFEGHDTVSMALSFCLFALANHKHIQDNARAEIDEIFKDSTRSASYRDLQSLQYFEMVIKESLRFYPSVPLIMRNINEDVPFRDGQYTIPKGCMIQIHIIDLHRNPKIFPNPEKFDPDRFLPENVRGRHPYAYIPFSAGPRNCIGQKFALLEIKCVLSSILRHYEIEPIDRRENFKIITDLVLRPTDGIHVKFKLRSK